jgi:hypothetical protein
MKMIWIVGVAVSLAKVCDPWSPDLHKAGKALIAVPAILLLASLLIWSLGAAPAAAQSGGDYDLTWSTVDGGGKYSAGDGYWLGGAAGQSDAGRLTGGTALDDFELTGGFWRIKAEHPTAVNLVALSVRLNRSPWAALAALALAVTGLAILRWRFRPGRF